MKKTLDLEQLLSKGCITQAEYDKLTMLPGKTKNYLVLNLLIGLLTIMASYFILVKSPTTTTAITVGLCVLFTGLLLLRSRFKQWKTLSNTCILIGSLIAGLGVASITNNNFISFVTVTIILTLISIFSKSSLLSCLSVLMVSASACADKYEYIPRYLFIMPEYSTTIIIFSTLTIVLYVISTKVQTEYKSITITALKTSLILANIGFWLSTMFVESLIQIIPQSAFSLMWTAMLLITILWSWKHKNRWCLNISATFSIIHLYTQGMSHFKASTTTNVILIGAAVFFAVVIWLANKKMKQKSPCN